MGSIGFTGTQSGWTSNQLVHMHMILNRLHRAGFEVMHNGDCVGSDKQAADHWHSIGGSIFLHPPTVDAKRAFLHAEWSADPLPYLTRNKAIVAASVLLIATPGAMEEELRSGTWATIRNARSRSRPTIIVWPNGTITKENYAVDLSPTRRDAGWARRD